MADIRLEIQGRKFPIPIKLLLAVVENFPCSWPSVENKYAYLANAIIDLHIPSLQQALATRRALPFELQAALWDSGDLETRRILLDNQGFVNRLGGRRIREILAMNDIVMLEKLARHLELPKNPREIDFSLRKAWMDEKTAKELIRALTIHPARAVRMALLLNKKIPDIYFK